MHAINAFCRVGKILLLLCAFNLGVHGQSMTAEEELFISNSAEDFVSFGDFESALDLYSQLDSLRPGNANYAFKRGLCTYHAGDKPASLLYFLKAYKLGYRKPEIYLFLGKAYHFNFDLENAVYYLEEYLTILPADTLHYDFLRNEALSLKNQILSSKEILEKKLSVDIRNLGAAINSEYAEYVPISLGSDSVLVFTSRRSNSTGGKLAPDGLHYEDIYVSTRSAGGQWQTPDPFPQFNGSRHDANVAINKEGSVLYIFKANRNGDIFYSTRKQNSSWTKPRRVKGINSRHWEGSICLSPTEDTLYFSSDRPGGHGGSDIYYATREGSKWTNVRNLGSVINTELDEDAPYMYRDGKTFFFSSKGHGSIGGYDVFSIKHIEGQWSGLKNVGFPINSIADDIYFQLNSAASIGYFTSYRYSNFKESSIGEKDLFEIERPHSSPVYFVFKGRVFDEKTRDPIPAIVTIKNLEDTTAATQRLVVDINSGKFRTDLKFENRYRINVEVNGKVYFSKELYYPYQPDLFETFLDIPLRNVPVFKMKLTDVLLGEADSTANTILDDRKQETIVLVRKVPLNDPQLQELLTSQKIPALFRKRILEQLQGKVFADQPDEGNLVGDLIREMRETLPEEQPPVFYAKLDAESTNTVSNVSVAELLTGAGDDSINENAKRYESLSEEEKAVVERMVEALISNDDQAATSFDEVYYASLTPEERERINAIVASEADRLIANDSTLDEGDRDRAYRDLYSFIDNKGFKHNGNMPLRFSDKGAWGILHTIESTRFSHKESERIVFEGQVLFRNNQTPAGEVELLLTDDSGMIYSRRRTDHDGMIRFPDLIPGRRYHILVNDYAIVLLGYSRYVMRIVEMRANEEDYMAFYNKLTPEEKRSVDRIIAARLSENRGEGEKWNSGVAFDKLSDTDKNFIERVKKYVKASSMDNPDFFMDKKDAYYYDQYNSFLRESINQLIAEGITPDKRDSLFFDRLDSKEKGYIDKIMQGRSGRRTLFDDILSSQRESDYWYILDEIKCNSDTITGAVSISGRVLYKHKAPGQEIQVALMDEGRQIVSASVTDSSGYVLFTGLECGRSYKVMINTGSDIGNLADYSFSEQQTHHDVDRFLSSLSAEDKRMINRIIAIQLAGEQYQKEDSLHHRDLHTYKSLSPEGRKFIERLRHHLFSDSISAENARLTRSDNNTYYMLLAPDERDFINRVVVKTHFSEILKTQEVKLNGREKKYYDQLLLNEREVINKLLRQRRAERDIFAEDPVLITEKAWTLLDSISSQGVEADFQITGRILYAKDSTEATGIPVMITNERHDIIGIVSTDSTGLFVMKGVPPGNDYFILAQDKRNLFSMKPSYMLADLRMVLTKTDSSVLEILPVVYFDFNSYHIRAQELGKISEFVKTHGHETIVIMIEGHTDHVGSDAYNRQLSLKRARSVRDELVHRGFNPQLLRMKGSGESNRIYSGEKEGMNRRVEIIRIRP